MTILERVMRVTRPVVFRCDKGCYGSVYTDRRTPIIINLSLHERKLPSRTLLHECLHVVFPEMSERNVRALEEVIWQTMTAKQRFLLAKKLYNRRWRTK